MGSEEELLNQRFEKIYSWAQGNGIVLIPGTGSGYTFSFPGKDGRRLVSFFKEGPSKGTIYAYTGENTFPGNAAEKKAFIDELKSTNLLDVSTNPSHHDLRKKLYDLTDNEFKKLLTILEKYCG